MKRALAKLKVEAGWFAPVKRNKFEVAWYRRADAYVPRSTPKILAHDESIELCAMEFLEPRLHKLWKTEPHPSRANVDNAHRVGEMLGLMHAGVAKAPQSSQSLSLKRYLSCHSA